LPPCYRQDANGTWLPEAAGSGYRLPTEAEWENACRAGTTTHHPFGDDPAMFPRHSRSGGQWWAFSKVQRPILVGLTPPNAFVLYDMDTNVYEWCQDGFSREFYAQSPPEDPVAPLSGDGMIRGGEWAGRPFVRSRSAFRDVTPPLTRREDIGFRVVRLTPAVARRGSSAKAVKNAAPKRGKTRGS
jgi:eukaryotic-like serine/threonine-protein kinase